MLKVFWFCEQHNTNTPVMAGLPRQLLQADRLIRYSTTQGALLLLTAVINDGGSRGRNDGKGVLAWMIIAL